MFALRGATLPLSLKPSRRITDKGRAVLEIMEARPAPAQQATELPDVRAVGEPTLAKPTLHCPNCNHEIRLTESLAAPLLAETRQRFQQQLASKDAEMERKTEALRLEREQVAKDREQIEDQVAKRLTAERAQLVAAESKKATDVIRIT